MAHRQSIRTPSARRRARGPKWQEVVFQLHDRVRVRVDVVGEDGRLVPAGCVGTVVVRWAHGIAYEVEFTHPPQALATIEPSGLEMVERPPA